MPRLRLMAPTHPRKAVMVTRMPMTMMRAASVVDVNPSTESAMAYEPMAISAAPEN